MGRKLSNSLRAAWWAATLAPAVFFFYVLLHMAIGLPYEDDYLAVLNFMNGYLQTPAGRARVLYFAASQHVQYKLWFEHALYIGWHHFLGPLNLSVLEQVGNLFVPAIFCVLVWQASRRDGRTLLPVALLVFSLRPGETLNWTMGSLQNVSVIAFALLAIALLLRPGAAVFAAAVGSMLLAIASSGNGFLLCAVGAWMLLRAKRWPALAVWVLAGAATVVPYAYRYQFGSAIEPKVGPVFSALTALVYPVIFIGGAVPVWPLALVLGLFLCAIFWNLCRRGLRARAPFFFYSLVFVAVTALAVDGTRHALGPVSAVSSRYSLYSLLTVALLYLGSVAVNGRKAEVEETLPIDVRPYRAIPYRVFLLLCVANWVFGSVAGYIIVMRRAHTQEQSMTEYLRAPLDPAARARIAGLIDDPATKLETAERLGVYRLPHVYEPPHGIRRLHAVK